MKKNAGTVFGSRSPIWARRLPSIRATATSTVSPAPSATSTAVCRRAGPLQAVHRQPDGGWPGPRQPARGHGHGGGAAAERQQRRGGAGNEDRPKQPVGGGENGQRGQRQRGSRRHRETGGTRPAVQAHHALTEQVARRLLPRPAQRPQGECERGQETECRRGEQRLGIDAERDPDRQQRVERFEQEERQDHAEGEPQRRAQTGQDEDLQEVGCRHQTSRGAEALQRRDRRRLAVEVVADRAGHPEAADQQRRQPGKAQEHRKPFDEALDAGRGIGSVTDLPAGLRESGACGGGPDLRIVALGKQDTGAVPQQAAGLDEAGRRQCLAGDHQARAEGGDAGDPVRLALDRAAQLEPGVAQADAIAGGQTQLRDQGRFGDRSPHPVPIGQQRVQLFRRRQLDPAEQRISRVDGLQFDHGKPFPARFGPHHRPHLDHLRDGVGPRAQESLFGRRRDALRQPHLDVAAEQQPRVGAQGGRDPLAHRGDGGDRGHPERETRQEHAEAFDAAPQFAPGQAPGEREFGSSPDAEPLRRGGAAVAADPPVADLDDPVAGLCHRRVVGDQEQRRVAAAVQIVQQTDDRFTGGAIEIAGRLVGEQEAGLAGEGPGKRHPLLLAAGELGRIVCHPGGKADRGQPLAGTRQGVGGVGQFERQRDVFQGGHGRHQVEVLKYDTDMIPAEAGEGIFIEGAQLLAGRPNGAGRRPFEAGDDHQQAGLPGAGRADETDRFAPLDDQIDAAQDGHRPRRAGQAEMHALETDGGRRGIG